MSDRFLTYTPYQGGMSNCRMNFECVLALALALDRKLVIPDRRYRHAIEAEVHGPLFRPLHPRHFLDLTEAEKRRHIVPASELPTGGTAFTPPPFAVGQTIAVVDATEVAPGFAAGRAPLSFVSDADVLHVPPVLEPFYAWIWSGDREQRAELTCGVNNLCGYHAAVWEQAARLSLNLGSYDAVLIRRAEAVAFYPQIDIPAADIVSRLLLSIPPDRQLVVATDEADRDWFAPFHRHWKLVFLRDLVLARLPPHWNQPMIACTEQLVCSHATTFVGTRLSTFSSYVSRLRGLDGQTAPILHTDGTWGSDTDRGEYSWEHYIRSGQPSWAREFREGWA